MTSGEAINTVDWIANSHWWGELGMNERTALRIVLRMARTAYGMAEGRAHDESSTGDGSKEKT